LYFHSFQASAFSIELSSWKAFALGLFFLVFSWSLGRHNAVPLKDPRMRECLGFHE